MRNAFRNNLVMILFAGGVFVVAAAAHGGGLQPRPAVLKPAQTELHGYHRLDVIKVKFHDDAPVRARDGALTDFGIGELAAARDVLALLGDARWRPLVDLPDADLENLRQTAQGNLGKAIADFRVWFHVFLPETVDAGLAIDALNALQCVELAEPVQDAAPAPTPPSYGAIERHHNAGPVGLGAMATWEHLGTRGGGAVVVDVEFGYDFHQDLPAINQIGPPGDPATQSQRDHGTASLGVIGAQANGWGTSGMAPDAWLGFAAVKQGGVVNVPAAIINAVNSTGISGAIILIEQQLAGPAVCGADPCTPLGLPPCDCSAGTAWVPIEWDLAAYNAIVTAVGAGKTVIEAAGNGAQDLDAAIYSTGNNGHWPFLAPNDSGAVMVGAGHGFDFVDTIGARICCSNYGSRVDVSAYGTAVRTTGYGDLYSAEGPSLSYTSQFAGTSSASAIVAGVAALVQAKYLAVSGGPGGPVWMSPAAMRSVLVQSGSPQPPSYNYPFPASQNIGPMPDASIAILLAAGGCIPLYDTSIGNPGVNSQVEDLLSFDDGNGAKLYAAGWFLNAGNDPNADGVAVWNGSSWSAVGTGPGLGIAAYDLEVFNDGNGAALYAAGSSGFGDDVLRWNGSTWTALGSGFDGPVYAMAVFNGSLYAGGFFTNAGGTSASNIARWNGSVWSAVGAGTDQAVYALQAYNDGAGVDLYAAGDFLNAGGNAASRIARWDGSNWSAVGAGFVNTVWSLAVFHDGTSLELYAGGWFQQAAGNYISRWNGQQWSVLGTALYNGTGGGVFTMAVFDDGTGPALFVGGTFEQVAEAWSPRVAKWDGTRWWALGDGTDAGVSALAVHDDGGGPSLYVGGSFANAYDLPASNVVEWDGCPVTPCPGDVDGDGTVGINDFLALLAAWGPNPGHPADSDGDGVVGIADFLALLAGWGNC